MRFWRTYCTLRTWVNESRVHRGLWLSSLLALLLLCTVLSVCIGSTSLSLSDALADLLSGRTGSPSYRILVHVRLPRTAAALLTGAALSVSGVLIQGTLHNALAGPNIIGVNAGAGFCALLCGALLPAMPRLVPAASFLGAMGTGLFIFALSAVGGAGRLTIVLAGVAVSGILSAGIDAITVLFPDLAISAASFMIGGFSGISRGHLFPALWYILGAGVCALFCGRFLNVLSLGEETAQSLGMRVVRVRLLLLALASMLAGASVSIGGLLGFVGLLVPHITRRLIGTDHRLLIPSSALLGACFVLLCDTASRVLFAPYEFPVGIVMSLCGGPFFLWLLLRAKGGMDDGIL